METQKEKSQLPSALLKDRSNCAAELVKTSVQDELVKSDENSRRLCVARNSQVNSVSPTSHKVQFAASLVDDDDDEIDNPAARGPHTTAAGGTNSLQQHQAKNYFPPIHIMSSQYITSFLKAPNV